MPRPFKMGTGDGMLTNRWPSVEDVSVVELTAAISCPRNSGN
jgi:hypothetical protein